MLLVGEGLAEYTFLASVKAIATKDGNGPSVTLRQASGKGALHVVEYARKQWKAGGIERCAVFLDSDTTCYDRAVKAAAGAGMVLITNSPCLEASLLALKGARPVPETSAECKAAFVARYGGEAHHRNVLEKHFSPDAALLRRFPTVAALGLLLATLDFDIEQ